MEHINNVYISNGGYLLFFRLLQNLENNSFLSRKEIVIKLQSFHSAFHSLDEITFCRWVNATTTPSFYKQILLTKFFSFPFSTLVEIMDYMPVSKKQKIIYGKTLNIFDDSYHGVSYGRIPLGNVTLKYRPLDVDEHWKMLGQFYKNIGASNNIKFMTEKKHHNITTHLFAMENKGELLSHTACILEAKQYFSYLNIELSGVSDKSSLINVSYYTCSSFFEILIGNMLTHIEQNRPDIDDVYIAFRGGQFLNFLEDLGGDIVWVDRSRSKIGAIYLAKIEWATLMSNPVVFNLIKAQNMSYKMISNFKVVNLNY